MTAGSAQRTGRGDSPSTGGSPAAPGSAAASGGRLDPFAPAAPAPAWRFLHHLNPLAKVLAPVPVMVLIAFSRGIPVPLAFAIFAIALLLLGARLSRGALLLVLVAIPIVTLLVGVSFGIWIDPGRIGADDPGAGIVLVQLGDLRFTLAAYLFGLATALRLASIALLALLAGFTTTGPDLVRAMVQNLRVPYRIGYTVLASYRFAPRFRHELEVIRAAHRVRGTDAGRGPIAAIGRAIGYAVPLLASAIRHAERVALAMDARAFGAHPTRTERHRMPWRVRDTVFVACFLAASAVLAWWAWGAA
ncbi:energy-coupling factor transporter transmembrane protein EcfT [Streptomyces sp. ISL-90]|nr:energy-coupling factor transporter transmembrane protein EcfT [Streptomyces sp. ISL-90]